MGNASKKEKVFNCNIYVFGDDESFDVDEFFSTCGVRRSHIQSTVVVYAYEGEILGAVSFSILPYADYTVAVAPEFRRMGIGSSLTRDFIDEIGAYISDGIITEDDVNPTFITSVSRDIFIGVAMDAMPELAERIIRMMMRPTR